MAKTRMKTTPTRMQNDGFIANGTTTTTATTAGTTINVTMKAVDDAKKRLRLTTASPKEPIHATSTIIVTAPKRTNSISSAGSSISLISDTHSTHSDSESPPPPPLIPTATAATVTTLPNLVTTPSSQMPRTLNSSLYKQSAAQIAALKNRKVYMITERCDESSLDSTQSHTTAGQKRKMYLIMEENSTESNDALLGDNETAKYLKSEQQGPKKLTLFADKSDVVLTQKFEKILPEILQRIQTKEGEMINTIGTNATVMTPASLPIGGNKLSNGMTNTAEMQQMTTVTKDEPMGAKIEFENQNKRLPITLPPKKNRTKIITINNNNNNTNAVINNGDMIAQNTGNNNVITRSNANQQIQIKQISAATPVIVSTASLPSTLNGSNVENNHNLNNGTNKPLLKNGQTCVPQLTGAQLSGHKNINLSTDFLFLMKMLPKLESIPEPHKNNVKNYIEKIVTQNANLFAKQ